MFTNLVKLNILRYNRTFSTLNRFIVIRSIEVTSKLKDKISKKYCTKPVNHLVSTGIENLFTYQTIKNAVRYPNPLDNTINNDIVGMLGNSGLTEQEKSEITNKLKSHSDEDLVKLLMEIEKVELNEATKELIKLIDFEGSLRVSKAEPWVALAGAIQMYLLKMNYRSEWIWSCLKRFCRRLDKISSSEVLQVMFLINLTRKIPQQYSGFDVQHNLVSHIDKFSLEELSLISIAFFKSETKLNNKIIMSKIMRKLLAEAETCGTISIGLLCKIIKYSLPIELSEELLILQDKLVKQVSRIELRSLTHVALAGSNVLVCHEPLIRAIIDRVRNILPQLRLKDMERLLFVTSLFNIQDVDFTERVIKELENREEEIKKFPKAFVSLVNYLIVLESFQEVLINRVLSDEFVKNTYINYKRIGGELIFIDKSVELERPNYVGNRLSQKIMITSAKIMTFTKSSVLTGTQRFSYELQDILTQLYGKDNQAFVAIVPHFYFPDFVLCFNTDLISKQIPQDIIPHRWGEIKKAPDNKHIWLCVIVGGWNTLVRNTEEPLGTTHTKMRQVRRLGYHPVLIPYFSYRHAGDKLSKVKNLIDQELKKIDMKQIAKTN